MKIDKTQVIDVARILKEEKENKKPSLIEKTQVVDVSLLLKKEEEEIPLRQDVSLRSEETGNMISKELKNLFWAILYFVVLFALGRIFR